jgi:type I restriction enzyme R subunit
MFDNQGGCGKLSICYILMNEAFGEYLNETNYDSRQIYFVNQIVEYVVHNGMIKDMSVLMETPFTDRGSINDIFTTSV